MKCAAEIQLFYSTKNCYVGEFLPLQSISLLTVVKIKLVWTDSEGRRHDSAWVRRALTQGFRLLRLRTTVYGTLDSFVRADRRASCRNIGLLLHDQRWILDRISEKKGISSG